jgi:5'-nucleotidase
MWERAGWTLAVILVGLGCKGAPLPDSSAQNGARETRLTLLHTSDLHSRVWPFWARISAFEAKLGLGRAGALEQVGGFARVAYVLDRERQSGAALWLDSGDALEGAEVFGRFKGQVELELLSKLGLSAMALGNHELSLPAVELSALLQHAPFPVLAANLEGRAGSPLSGRLGSSAFVHAEGLVLALVGVANPHSPPDLLGSENAWGLAVAADLAAAVQATIDAVAPRADLVVLLSHLGLDADRELVSATTGVHLVLGGHQHLVTEVPDWQQDCLLPVLRGQRRCVSKPVPIVHSGAYGKLLSRVELSLAATGSGGAWQVTQVALAQLPLAASVPAAPDVLQRLAELEPPAQEPLGFAPEPLRRRAALGGDSALGNLVADALASVTGADVVLLNSSLLRADLEAGLVLQTDLELVLPFAEPWVVARISGARLGQGLLQSALRSAARACEAGLQVAGIELRIDCAACRADRSGCVQALRRGPFGAVQLGDAEIVQLVLPGYLTRHGADFEGLNGEETALEPSLVEALARQLRAMTQGLDAGPCVQALAGLAPARCQQAFSSEGCPIDPQRARSWCGSWPWIVGGADGRIQMLP